MSARRGTIVHVQKVAGVAGSENHLLVLLPALRERGWDVQMVVLAGPRDEPEEFASTLEREGVPTGVVPMRADVDLVALRRLRVELLSRRPVLVHTHLLHADLYGAAALALSPEVPSIQTRHNDDPFRGQPGLSALIRRSASRARRVICISESVRSFCRDVEMADESHLVTVRYGIGLSDVEADRSWRDDLGWGDDAVVAGIVARLTEQKGHSTLLRAFAEVRRNFPVARLAIVGDGDLRPVLESMVRSLRLEDVVAFLGHHPRGARMMAGFDLFVHPSRWEGFGLVFLEAMAAGLPVVATRASAIPEIVVDGVTGVLVGVDDVSALAAAMMKVLGDGAAARMMGERGRARIEEEFTVSAMVARTEAVYLDVLVRPETGKNRL